jgi:hypothetical protein
VITLSERLGHATPQVTMTTYAAEIEEANDSAIRKARVNALFGGTQMAGTGCDSPRETASPETAEIVSLARVGESLEPGASAAG